MNLEPPPIEFQQKASWLPCWERILSLKPGTRQGRVTVGRATEFIQRCSLGGIGNEGLLPRPLCVGKRGRVCHRPPTQVHRPVLLFGLGNWAWDKYVGLVGWSRMVWPPSDIQPCSRLCLWWPVEDGLRAQSRVFLFQSILRKPSSGRQRGGSTFRGKPAGQGRVDEPSLGLLISPPPHTTHFF